MKMPVRISVILFLLLSVAPPALHAAPATAAPSADTPALPAAAQAVGATPTWWATVQADMARAVPGIDPADPSPTPNWTRFGDQDSARLGRASSGAGDVNGDGFDDLLVGAEWYDNGEVDEGRVYLFYGSPTGLAAQPAWTAESNVAGSSFGACATTAGDVNGDGFADVIVGAPLLQNGQSSEGRVYLYLGSAAGLGAAPAWTWESDQADARLTCAAAAGDVNGDGYSDVLAIAPGYDAGQTDEGKVFLFHGSASGLQGAPDWTAESNQAGALLSSGGTAGDVDGDGFGDLILGAQRYDNGQTDEGRAFLYLGSASGLTTVPAWTAESNQDSAELGLSASTAGDVNGDGYADVVVGARYYDHGETDEGAAFVYLGSPAGLATAYTWMAEGNQILATFGMFSTTAGDVNGDGYADLLINAPNYSAGEEREGRAYVYYGSSSGVRTTPAWTAEGNQAWALFGYSFPGHAGDVNGDGYADIAVGALWYDSSQTDEGAAFVYHGGPDGLSTTADWSNQGGQGGALYGLSVGSAGDVNGDGYADVTVYAQNFSNSQTVEGRAYVYYGGSTGLPASPNWLAEGNQDYAYFGGGGTAGDVNGDGYDDVIISAPGYDGDQVDEGRLFVYYGSSIGLSATPNWIAESDQAGASCCLVGRAGDVNGDGFADIVAGAVYYDHGQVDEGVAWVWYGGPTGLGLPGNPGNADWTAESNQTDARFGWVNTAGDVNGDGYSDVIIGAPFFDDTLVDQGRVYVYGGSQDGLQTTPAWIVQGDQTSQNLGYRVASAGDVDGDSYSDVVLGVPFYANGEVDEGQARVYRGSSAGLDTTPSWVVEGNQPAAYLGYSAKGAGDVNGDGFADVIVGVLRYDGGQWDEGRALVYFGSGNGLSADAAWAVESNQDDSRFGVAVDGAGDVNGDGYGDVVVGAFRYDVSAYDEGAAFAYYGNHGGLSLRPQQLHSDQRAPIAHLGQSDRPDRFRLALLGRTPFGRGKVKLEWEVKLRGVLFDGTGVQRSAAWLDTGIAGAQLDELISGLSTNTLYHWRVRLRYQPATTPFQSYSRWLTNPWNGWNEARLRTALEVPTSVTLASFDAVAPLGREMSAWLLGLILGLLTVGGILARRLVRAPR